MAFYILYINQINKIPLNSRNRIEMVTFRQEYKTIITQADRNVDHSIENNGVLNIQLPNRKN